MDAIEGQEHITALADRYAPYAKLIRAGIEQTDKLGDADTADLFTEVSRGVDMRLWFLEAHLQAGAIATEATPDLTNGSGTKAIATAAKATRTSSAGSAAQATKATTAKTTPKTTAKKTKAKSK